MAITVIPAAMNPPMSRREAMSRFYDILRTRNAKHNNSSTSVE